MLKPLTVWLTHTHTKKKKQWKILQRMGIPDHLTCLLRNKYAGQEATVRRGHGTQTAYLISMQSTSCKMPGWMKFKLESSLVGEISMISEMQLTTPL